MSGEYFPTKKEWILWFQGRKEEAIKTYLERDKYRLSAPEKPIAWVPIRDTKNKEEIRTRFEMWSEENKFAYQSFLLTRYDKFLDKVLNESD